MMRKIVLALICCVAIKLSVAGGSEKTAVDARSYWCETAYKIAYPVLDALSKEQLKAKMPIESPNPDSRKDYAHLEAFGRLLCGLAPWLELGPDNTDEGKMRAELLELAHKSVRKAVDPKSKDYMNFSKPSQPLVDAAFLAQAFIRSPEKLWGGLDKETQKMVIEALKLTREIKPYLSNWLLFSATIEAFFLQIGEPWDATRVDFALNKHEDWYKGDGVYGDGVDFHWDYYNSYVIQPMLADIYTIMLSMKKCSQQSYDKIMNRAIRYGEIQERLISPEGTFPAIGRSLPYRIGAMQTLSMVALMKKLPKNVSPAQVRCALTAVAKRMFDAPGTFDKNGWLTIGFTGHQPGIAESYICTGSLYLCSVGFLHLGLPPQDEFWTAPEEKWTQQKAWNGENFPIDKAM
ncbi:MAG: DUF2264 domain-containing protein [Prolixibacteraceae bacterium]|nr:DUF2264 domain-containing protein [Prolixibacteraceae bacterium]